ncbi:MAG: phosphoribosylanthranilate isomerase [Betaproteobacteria bacterium]|nr:phosphoribosylanthranilate isomerase [Betaproteobacteria bacterium]
MSARTRIKLCGLTRRPDVEAAVALGADAIGLVFYPPSPRSVTAQTAGQILAQLPAFVSAVGLFVNPTLAEVQACIDAAPISILQFHGDETPAQCAAIAQQVRRPFLRALRIRPEMNASDLLEFEHAYRTSSPLFAGLLLDTWSDAYGGTGKVFDWSLIPAELAHRAVLSGGLNAQNATGAVRQLHPHAVDVSSGIESAKGVKDVALMRAFIAAVRSADQE